MHYPHTNLIPPQGWGWGKITRAELGFGASRTFLAECQRTVGSGGLLDAPTDQVFTGQLHMSLRTKKNIWERWEQAKCDSMFSQCLILIIIIINNNINTEKKIKCLNASCFPLVIHVPFTMYPRPCSSCHLCQQFPFVYHRSHTHTYIYSYIERFVFVFLTFFFSFFHFFIHTQKSEKKWK